MPRLGHRLVRHAASIDKHLPLLLRECRDLRSAKNELRWLMEHVRNSKKNSLRNLVWRRARGVPLQYILGSQPFGALDILSRPNVLIPRPETENYVLQLAELLRKQCGENVDDTTRKLSIADICTGTGCIALLLYHELHRQFDVTVTGYDVSNHALSLAKENLVHNTDLGDLDASALEKVIFQELDVLSFACQNKDKVVHEFLQPVDIIISNPPYISPAQYRPGGTTSPSVRKFEPKEALVPPAKLFFPEVQRADQFYVALLRVAERVDAKVLVMEVGDNDQALRVAELSRRCFVRDSSGPKTRVEVWKDDGTVIIGDGAQGSVKTQLSGTDIDARAVVLWLDEKWEG